MTQCFVLVLLLLLMANGVIRAKLVSLVLPIVKLVKVLMSILAQVVLRLELLIFPL